MSNATTYPALALFTITNTAPDQNADLLVKEEAPRGQVFMWKFKVCFGEAEGHQDMILNTVFFRSWKTLCVLEGSLVKRKRN
jgi:hypothetical protein